MRSPLYPVICPSTKALLAYFVFFQTSPWFTLPLAHHPTLSFAWDHEHPAILPSVHSLRPLFKKQSLSRECYVWSNHELSSNCDLLLVRRDEIAWNSERARAIAKMLYFLPRGSTGDWLVFFRGYSRAFAQDVLRWLFINTSVRDRIIEKRCQQK